MEAPPSSSTADALRVLAAELRAEGPEVSDHVLDPVGEPVLGMLVADGPRCAAAPGEYAAIVESIREGFLLHYGTPRLLAADDPDLRLLVGDHLYARGIERLARLGDLLAVTELSNLISTAAQLDAAPGSDPDSAEVAWLAAAVTIAAGPGEELEEAKSALRRSGDPGPLWSAAAERAEGAGLSEQLSRAAEAVGFAPPNRG